MASPTAQQAASVEEDGTGQPRASLDLVFDHNPNGEGWVLLVLLLLVGLPSLLGIPFPALG